MMYFDKSVDDYSCDEEDLDQLQNGVIHRYDVHCTASQWS